MLSRFAPNDIVPLRQLLVKNDSLCGEEFFLLLLRRNSCNSTLTSSVTSSTADTSDLDSSKDWNSALALIELSLNIEITNWIFSDIHKRIFEKLLCVVKSSRSLGRINILV